MVKELLLLRDAVYSPGRSRKKKAMQAMSATARAPSVGDVMAISIVV